MSRRAFTTLVLLALTTHVAPQFIDYFQGFGSFLQPFQTTRRSDVTKRPAHRTTKPLYQDTIFFETDDFIKQKVTTSTVKPKKKSKTTRPSTRLPWIIESNDNSQYDNGQVNVYDTNGQIINNNRQTGNNKRVNNGNSNRGIDDGDNRRDGNKRVNENIYGINNYNNYDVTNINYNNRETTSKPYNNFGVAQKPIHSPNNRYTTINPLLYRPGVKPAVVDDNRPPITNKPITNRPVYIDKPAKPSRPNEFDVNNDADPVIKIGPDEDDMSEAEKRRYYEIAEQKCDEYKALNTKKVVALPLAGGQGVEVNVSTCKPTNIPLIIGGKIVSIEEFPHMGLVGWRNLQDDGYSWKCGSSLISEQFVLTAGHCTYHEKDYNVVSGPPHAIQLGSSYLNGKDALVVTISMVVRHPKYKLRRAYYDVALIKLTTSVKFSKSIRPACLGVPPPVGDSIIATGWGRTEFGGDSSHELRSVSIPIWEMESCRTVWGTSRKLPDGPSPASQLCAGARQGGKDTCQGDSGGPAQVQDGCMWRVVAVTSIGRSCGAAETPALYARVPRAFIASQVFANVKLNKNNGNNWGNNNNGFNSNPNQFTTQNTGINNHSGNNQFGSNSQGSQFGNSGSNREIHKPISSVVSNNNQFSTSQNTGNRDRPGNHQTISNQPTQATTHINSNLGNRHDTQNSGTYNQYTTQNPGNYNQYTTQNSGIYNQYTTQNPGIYNQFGNNQYTTQKSGHSRDEVVYRPGNHQTDRREINNEGVYNNHNTNRAPIVGGPVNTEDNRGTNNRNTHNNNRNPGSQDTVYTPGNHQRVENNQPTHNINNDAIIRDTNTWASSRPDANRNDQNNYDNRRTTTVKYYNNNDRGSYNQNNAQNVRTTEGYNAGVQNSNYFSTENPYNSNNANNHYNNGYNQNNNGYNQNNNGYNQNNNGYNQNNGYNSNYGYNDNEFIIANRPWWNR